jgi:hypothetical protein
MNIATSDDEKITTQTYVTIDGVELILKPMPMVVIFLSCCSHAVLKSTPFVAQQISMSIMVPGAVKAYHIHNSQDLWLFLTLNLLVIYVSSSTRQSLENSSW